MSRANKRWFRKKHIFHRRKSVGGSSIRGSMFSKRRRNWGGIVLACAAILLVGFSAFYFFTEGIEVAATEPEIQKVNMKIHMSDVSIYQDEVLPEIMLDIKGESEEPAIQGFIENTRAGIGYSIQAEGDLSQEGEYNLSLVWDEDVKAKLDGEWKELLDIKYYAGTVTVKNSIGEWEGDKFKKRDGTYATDEFITLHGNEYYFNQDGKKVTGEYEFDGRTYYFTEEGIFDTEKNTFHPTKPKIAITFDDGPGLYTEELLSILEENDARATFFLLGKQVKSFPEAVEKMKEIGCEIGNHTYSHARLSELSKKDMKSQIDKTNKAVKDVIGSSTGLVRPPYGDVTSSVRKNVKYPLIMWSLDTEDWKLKDADKIVDCVLSQVKEGDIVLLHDIHEFTFEAMKTVIPELIERGYQLVTVSELAEWNDVTLEAGTKYFGF